MCVQLSTDGPWHFHELLIWGSLLVNSRHPDPRRVVREGLGRTCCHHFRGIAGIAGITGIRGWIPIALVLCTGIVDQSFGPSCDSSFPRNITKNTMEKPGFPSKTYILRRFSLLFRLTDMAGRAGLRSSELVLAHPSSQHSTCLASQQGRCLGSQQGTISLWPGLVSWKNKSLPCLQQT